MKKGRFSKEQITGILSGGRPAEDTARRYMVKKNEHPREQLQRRPGV